MAERGPQALVIEDVRVVVEPDKGRQREAIPVEEREMNRPAQGIEKERAVNEERREDVEVGGKSALGVGGGTVCTVPPLGHVSSLP